MQIHILKDSTIRLEDADNFRDFKIVAETAEESLKEVGEALQGAGAGLADGSHAWISETWVRANKSAHEAWDDSFAKMLDFARSKEWVNDRGQIRAHVEWK